MTDSPYKRTIRSFVRREGRMTPAQQRAFDELWEFYGIEPDGLVDFDKLFKNTHPKILDIGFGMGDSLLERAQNEPEKNFIGIEVYKSGIGRLLNEAHKLNLKNIKVFCGDAVEILKNNIPKASIHTAQLFFPDPWHKKKHHKRRIVQKEFVETILKILKPNGVFHLATDWENYAEHMLEMMESFSEFENLAGKNQFAPRPKSRPLTKFEKRGLALGHGVRDLLYKKL